MEEVALGDGRHPLRGEVKLLLQAAMVVFVWTVVIGILNGADIVDFDRKVLLSHVHAGTLGWITTSVFAASLWLFGTGAAGAQLFWARVLTWASVVILPVFALSFAFTYEEPRAILGGAAAAAIVGVFAWVVARARRIEVSVVHLGFLAAVATSVVGAVLGVLLATEIATGRNAVPDGGDEAHPATMVVGFLVPVGMALAEWGLRGRPGDRADRAGVAQMALPFAGGILLMVGMLLDVDPLLPLATAIELVGVVIFFRRLSGPLRQVAWAERSPGRYAGASAIAIIVNIVFLNYLAGANGGNLDAAGTHQILALDHTMFIGVVTNAVFGMLLLATANRSRWPGVDGVVFAGMNLAMVGFVVGLLAESDWIIRISTPVLGLCILAGLLDRTLALLSAQPGAGTAAGVAPAVS